MPHGLRRQQLRERVSAALDSFSPTLTQEDWDYVRVDKWNMVQFSGPIDGADLEPREARDLAIELLLAADYAEKQES